MTRLARRLRAVESRCTSKSGKRHIPAHDRPEPAIAPAISRATSLSQLSGNLARPSRLSTPTSPRGWVCNSCRLGLSEQRRWFHGGWDGLRASRAIAGDEWTLRKTAHKIDGLRARQTENYATVAFEGVLENVHARGRPSERSAADRDLAEVERDEADLLLEQEMAESLPNYRDMIREGLMHEDSTKLLQALGEAVHDSKYIRSIPPTTFTQILRDLQPDRHFGDISEFRRRISLYIAQRNNMLHPDLHGLYASHIRKIKRLVAVRQGHAHRLGPSDIRIILRSADTAGDADLASEIWQYAESVGVRPDTDCWNFYLNAFIDRDHLHHNWANAVRTTDPHLARRAAYQSRGASSAGKFPGYEVGERGIRTMSKRLFGRMMAQGQVANEGTLCLLMKACSREGDTATADDILLQAWGIDAKSIRTTGRQNAAVKIFPAHSPLRPSGRLLWTVVHVYGRRQDVTGAFRLATFISRQYDIPLPMAAWEELAENTLIGCVVRTGVRNYTLNPRTLPHSSLRNLVLTMTSKPFEVTPTPYIYNLLCGSLAKQKLPDRIRSLVELGIDFADSSSFAAMQAKETFEGALRLSQLGFPQPVLAISPSRFRRHRDRVVMNAQRERWYLFRWFRLFKSAERQLGADCDFENTYVHIPEMMERLSGTFRKTHMSIGLPTGRLKFCLKAEPRRVMPRDMGAGKLPKDFFGNPDAAGGRHFGERGHAA